MNQTKLSAHLTVAPFICGSLLLPVLTQAQTAPPSAQPGPTEPDSLQEIVVTGTLIRGAAPVGSQLITVGQEDIAATGASTTQDHLANGLSRFRLTRPEGQHPKFCADRQPGNAADTTTNSTATLNIKHRTIRTADCCATSAATH
jgi:hypothetical protein